MTDRNFMRRTIILALRGRGLVSPNPRVGAVIVSRNGNVLSEGWHHRYGEAHAEVDALSRLIQDEARGATLYVNLEPCSHFHRTPPCTEAIIKAGISRVVYGTIDPNPAVNGKGIFQLKAAGVEVVQAGEPEELWEINRGFFSSVVRGRAWCEAKVALSLDGKMANQEGLSKWISGDKARVVAHRLRADLNAVLVGGGTLDVDDPELTVRLVKGHNPARIILSTKANISPATKLAQTAESIRTILVTGDKTSGVPGGVEILRLPLDEAGLISPESLLRALPQMGILSVLIEGGAGVLSNFLKADMLDRISVAYCPTVIGKGLSPFDYFVPDSWENRPAFILSKAKRIGEDVIVRYDRRQPSLPA